MKNNNRFIFILISVVCSVLVLGSCANFNFNLNSNKEPVAAPPYPNANFAIISDIHIWDPSLGSTEPRFIQEVGSSSTAYLNSIPYLDAAIEKIIDSGVSFVLVCGDLTREGELVNHQIVADKLKKLTDAKIKVFVIPGNHDIQNGNAVSFAGDVKKSVPYISHAQFARIYADYGFNTALSRDEYSLSYVTEPVNGLWLLSIDSNQYRNTLVGRGATFGGGLISQATANWINNVLRDAQNRNKAVIVMIHQALIASTASQQSNMALYMVKNYENVSKMLASWNVRVAFTGHNHSQSVGRADFGDKYIYDIQTGSLSRSSPYPIRYIEIKDNVMNVSTESVSESVSASDSFRTNAVNFFTVPF